jgi:serine/threonine-protein kinase RsbW
METMIDQRRCVWDRWIPAKLEAIDQVSAEVKTVLREWGMDRCSFDVILLAREALVNAVLYGCQQDPGKQVQFTLALDGDELVMTVEDPGPGFDWREKSHRGVDMSEEHGRGFLIFRCYATHFEYNDKGNRLTLRKAVSR